MLCGHDESIEKQLREVTAALNTVELRQKQNQSSLCAGGVAKFVAGGREVALLWTNS